MELPISSSFFSARKNPQKIEARNLTYHIHNSEYNFTRLFRNQSNPSSSWRVILQDVTCDAAPGELTAIAGPSGAGKTSLLEILGGIIHPSKVSAGKVVVNGRPVDPGSLRRLSGHVTQDEALFPLLTVEETLMYSALLRLPGNRAEAKSRVQQLMKELGLDHIATSRIQSGGSAHGISGGEKRRVSIGVELVHDPSVLLIDEPTSGLDSAAALHVITLLKSMAVKQGKTIVITIHQPGFRILQLLDRVILLSNGLLLHNGPLNFLEHKLRMVGHDIPRRVNVLEFAIDVAYTLPAEPSHSLFLHHPNNDSIANFNLTFPNSRFQEILILGQRFCRNIFRTKQLFPTRIIQSSTAGLILGTIFMNSSHDQGQLALQTRLGFFAFTLTFLLSSTTEGLPIFLQERRILMRETSRSAYRVSSYVLANTLVFIPFLLLVGLLYATPVYFLVGLRRDSFAFLYFSLVVWLVVLMSNSLVACFSALVPNFIMGTSVIAGLMGSFFLFSGYFITKESIPDYWVFMYYLSLFKYPFACFMINEYGGEQGRRRCVQRSSNGGVCELYGDELLRQQGIKEDERWTNLGMMLCFVVGYRLLSFVILWFRCHRTKN